MLERAAPAPPARRSPRTAALVALVFALALAPRALLVGRFVTVDEGVHWFGRAAAFLAALESRDWSGTFVAGHPGVTTAWLGAAGELLYRLLGHRDGALHQELLRAPVAVVTSLCVALALLPLRRLVGERAALAGALLWALDPFVVAHSQLLHLDALLASFMALALLTAMVAFGLDAPGAPPVRWGALATSAVCGGLALLTKSPALLLPPLVAAAALAAAVRGRAPLRPLAAGLLAWGALAAVTFVALWPATWADLPGTFARMLDEARDNGGTPHGLGNFFMGASVADPGPLFYPVAVALRLTPWVTLGLLACGAAVLAGGIRGRRATALALVAALAVLLVLGLTLLPKKFDRYALAAFPPIDILAGAGLVWLAEAAGARLGLARPRLVAGAGWALAAALLALNVAWYHPYELAYYNPALGGGPMAERAIPVGWGEGYELAGAFVAEQYDACERPTAVWYRVLVERFTCRNLIPMRDFEAGADAGYVILYIDQVQRGYYPGATARLYAVEPAHTVTVHGVDYAAVYQIPPQVDHTLDTVFGGRAALEGYSVDAAGWRAAGGITVTLRWRGLQPMAEDYTLFAHVFDAAGQRVAQVDVPAGDPRAPTSSWGGAVRVTQRQRIPLAPELPQGEYWIDIGLYSPADTRRLPLAGGPPDQTVLRIGPVSLKE